MHVRSGCTRIRVLQSEGPVNICEILPYLSILGDEFAMSPGQYCVCSLRGFNRTGYVIDDDSMMIRLF